MIIILPIGGIGQRFKDCGHTEPKALIKLNGKHMISYLLDNLRVDNIDYIFIPYNKDYKEHNFERILTKEHPHIKFKFHCLENNTRGAAETINIGINKLNEERNTPVLCLDSDNFYMCDIVSNWNGDNAIVSFKDYNTNPIFSYVEVNDKDEIIDIKEKDKISNYACTGAYGFRSIHELKKYTSIIIENNITQKNEFYTSGVVKYMLENDHSFRNIEVLNKHYFSLGTPKQVNEYEHPFIFDLDGTLVNTDDIYTKVWNIIMKKYNLSIDEKFFKFFIQGKNDISFIKTIAPGITEKEIQDISQVKDDIFIELLEKCEDEILVDGAFSFIHKNKNRRMGIVTSCNKRSAEYILKKTGLEDYMQFLIASEDCEFHKPNKEPYVKAMNLLQCSPDNCSIFEDSNSGYKSAKSSGVSNICIILNEDSNEYMLGIDEYKIKSYNDFDIVKMDNTEKKIMKDLITSALCEISIKDVIPDEQDMKTGYICDIKSYKVLLNNEFKNVVLKVENEDNELSNVARKINLYSNEVYFYEKIANIADIKTPKFYCALLIGNKKSILLENLNNYKGRFNIDLNKNIDILLSVVKDATELHNRFHFQTEQDVIPRMSEIYKINQITYYNELVENRFEKFVDINRILLNTDEVTCLRNIHNNYRNLTSKAGSFPLNFCHGDLKSPNIFYKDSIEGGNVIPFFLDWQYIHLNKGISDITFLLVESIDFDEDVVDIIIKYYYKKSNMYKKMDDLLFDFKVSLCIFPFFVMVWFNSENRDNLLDKVFPINFMKNLLKFYNKYLDQDFFNRLENE